MEIHGREVRTRGGLVKIGFIDGEGYQFLDDPASAIRELQSMRTGIDLFTFVQRLSETAPKFDYPLEWDNFAALQVTTFEEWMSKQIDFKTRNKVRKAAKNGVIVKEVPYDPEFVQGISAIYNETPMRQRKPFWHYGKDIESVRKMNGTFMGQSIFIGAYLEHELIGFVKLVMDENKGQAGLMQIVSLVKHRDKAPTNALIAQAVRSCAERGISFLWYANFTYGKKQEDGLAEFKRHNGFQKLDIPRFYVPLTMTGRVALRLGVHRPAADWVPESMVSTYRKARRIWYGRKFASLENA